MRLASFTPLCVFVLLRLTHALAGGSFHRISRRSIPPTTDQATLATPPDRVPWPLKRPRPSTRTIVSLRGGGLDDAFVVAKDSISAMGPAAPAGFALLFIACDMISFPCAPLAVFAGVLWGLGPGVAIVLGCGLVSAATSFMIGRSNQPRILAWLHSVKSVEDKFAGFDRILARGGFRALLLLRLVPTPLPFANYLFGITSVRLGEFVLASALGYFPGTVAMVYSGAAGTAMLSGGPAQPWYVYAGGAVALAAVGKVAMELLSELSSPEPSA